MIDLNKALNNEQILPVLETEGPVLVFAGAGSGKTRVLTHRIAHLILDKGIAPSNILAITFTNKAAATMMERVEQLAPVNGLTISTFHSFCAKQLRDLSAWLPNYKKNFSIYDDDDSKKLFVKVVKEEYYISTGNEEIPQEKLQKLILTLREKVSHAKNLGMLPEEYLQHMRDTKKYQEASMRFAFDVYSRYQKLLQKNNAMDFDDLLLNFYVLIKNNSEIKESLQNKFQYILVDEYQDTNAVQNRIVIELAGKKQNIFAVGDDDQSIYSWRGADITNIIEFEKAFPKVQTFKLETNYRSTKQILNVANNIIKNNKQRVDKTLKTLNEGGVRVELKTLANDFQEVEYIADQIQLLYANKMYRYSDFAVLMRNNYLSQKLETELIRRRIPYVFFGGFKFFHRAEIKMALAILQFIINPEDDVNLIKIMNEYPGVGNKTISIILETAKENNIGLYQLFLNYDQYNFSPRIIRILNTLSKYFQDIKRIFDDNQMYFMEHFEDIAKIEVLIKASDSTELNSRLQNINQLMLDFKNSLSEGVSLVDLIQKISLTGDADVVSEGDNVVVSTIHSVKGLEFGCVFLMAFEDGILPSAKAINSFNSLQIEEERRLTYVAVTRAKDRLYITRTNNRMYGGNHGYAVASRFLQETGLINKEPPFSNIRYNDNQMQNDAYYDRFIDNTPSKSFDNSLEFEQAKKKIQLKDISMYKIGQFIEHPNFGRGQILEINGGIAKIKFDTEGEKQISLRHVNLKIRG